MDVTEQIQNIHIKYGGSDSTNPSVLSASKKLNYAIGSSISSPETQNVAVIPYKFEYVDSVGLFGSQNHYIKVCVDVDFTLSNAQTQENSQEGDYFLANVISSEDTVSPFNDYTSAELDYNADVNSTINDYDSAEILLGFTPLPDGFISIQIDNLGTGNQYVDRNLDVTLYSREREEHPYDLMYIRPRDFFYIGFHARNDRRLPYKIDCTVGQQLEDRQSIEQRYIAKASRELPYTSIVDVQFQVL